MVDKKSRTADTSYMDKSKDGAIGLVIVGALWPGLEDLGDAREFIQGVEDAFEALDQPYAELSDEDEEEESITPAEFREWADTVENRLEYMGISKAHFRAPSAPKAPIEVEALKDWTRRVWARFAALGQTVLEVKDEDEDEGKRKKVNKKSK